MNWGTMGAENKPPAFYDLPPISDLFTPFFSAHFAPQK